MRDELILALDLYIREGRSPSVESLQELSALLRRMPIESALAGNQSFRNASAVGPKVSNFVALDPTSGTAGMSKGGKGDRTVWDEFHADPRRLEETAMAIRASIEAGAVRPPDDDDDVPDAPEGRLLTRSHRARERNKKIVARKKAQVRAATGRLSCEACGFDFASAYGARGDGFIECHHVVPLSALQPGSRTRLSDLALLCSNCHRMVHRTGAWLTMQELTSLVHAGKRPAAADGVHHGGA